ncbi:hypothetical protein BD310DRAFT_978598 [Dichomitus squalens]|uniref:Uncharacterized protein n=1 Tax=Dichomitus squalens TaxID=114155 RepID=A0A4Q9PQW2_9APHY|nr:hypothetical protein BD310DRAFT_978598 [Dichomitus squalens]
MGFCLTSVSCDPDCNFFQHRWTLDDDCRVGRYGQNTEPHTLDHIQPYSIVVRILGGRHTPQTGQSVVGNYWIRAYLDAVTYSSEAEWETGGRKQEAGKENMTTLHPIPVRIGNPLFSARSSTNCPSRKWKNPHTSLPEATEFVTKSVLAYLDSPSPAFSQPLSPSHMESYFVAESGSTMDDTQRTVSHSAFVPVPALTPALVPEADGGCVMALDGWSCIFFVYNGIAFVLACIGPLTFKDLLKQDKVAEVTPKWVGIQAISTTGLGQVPHRNYLGNRLRG